MWPNPQLPTDLVKFTEEILNEKLPILCSDFSLTPLKKKWVKRKIKKHKADEVMFDCNFDGEKEKLITTVLLRKVQ